jgi:hypothetical protein
VADVGWALLTALLFVLGLHCAQAGHEATAYAGMALGFAIATLLLAASIFTGLEVIGG